MGVGEGGRIQRGDRNYNIILCRVNIEQVLFSKQLLRFADEELPETKAELGDAFLRLPSTSHTGKHSQPSTVSTAHA